MSQEKGGKTAWITRFGILVDVTERKSQKGPYITFKLQAKDFVQYGACFDAAVIAEMKQAVQQNVWVRGPLESHPGRDASGAPVTRTSFKVLHFRVSAEANAAA